MYQDVFLGYEVWYSYYRYCVSYEIVLYLVLKIDQTEDTKSVKVTCTKINMFYFPSLGSVFLIISFPVISALHMLNSGTSSKLNLTATVSGPSSYGPIYKSP